MSPSPRKKNIPGTYRWYQEKSSVVMLGSDQSMKITFGLPTNYFGQVQVGDAATVQTATAAAAAREATAATA